MALNNVILLSQMAGYVIAFILSLCIAIPMTLHQDEFRGHCLLFSSGEWQDSGQFFVHWASQAYCNYTIFVGVVLSIISILQIYRMSILIYKGTDSNFLSAFFDVVGCFVLCGLSLIAALVITFGFIVWCNDMTMRFPSCDMASGQDIDKQDGIDTSNFYIELGTAQFGAWASMACWVGLSIFALLKMFQQHEIQNMRASMLRERQHLINETGSEKQPKSFPETTNSPPKF
ncbi:transmembrane protein 179 [Halyomorpha halys]|uniref:transmembrane protein 179 n=1 Tax=Halyomorpha halys TaxID=286706 RepID=UPI0006D51EF7|nr:transmembrane protein 179 [Halyomorpha halys]XP_014275061.1 transmembrane protein 179 [Halyomorpha halys]